MTALAGRLPRAKLPALGLLNVVLLLAVAGLGLAAYLALRAKAPTTGASVRTAAVSRGVVLQSVSASGSLQPASQLGVDFLTAGRLTSVPVEVGEHVSRGQILGRLDPTDDRAAVNEAVAALATARASLAETIQGETPLQRAADAVSLKQSKAQIATAESAVVTAKQQARQDRATSAQALVQASSTQGVIQAERQLRTDQGNERAAVAKLHSDQQQLTVDGTTYPTAAAAVAAATNTVRSDQARQQADQVANLDLQAKQTSDNQRLSADKAALAAAQAANDTTAAGIDTGYVNNDQNVVNADALQAAQLQKTLQQDGYTLSQDQSTLSTFTALQGTLTADQTSITGYESKIVSDRAAIANAKVTRTNAIASARSSQKASVTKDDQAIQSARQQVASAKLGYQSAVSSTAVKQAPPTAATLMQARAGVLQAQVNLASARRTLAQTVLRAPEAGMVAALGGIVGGMVSAGGTSNAAASSSSTSSGGSGSSGSSSSSSYVTLLGRGMQVSAEFSESDATNIRVGQPATVTVAALPTEELAAHVVSVSPLGSSSSGVVEFSVLFALDRTEPLLKAGMSANVSVTVAERDNVLNVPSAAVTG
jgi:multidrug efflux pump subunit AcrA (membrane-fusion protein)